MARSHTYIFSEIAQRLLQAFGSSHHRWCQLDQPTRPARARSTHFDRLWRFDWPRTTNFDRLRRLDVPQTTHFDRLCIEFDVIFDDFRVHFRRFSRLHRASESTCSTMSRTSVFAGRRGTKQGFRIVRQSQTSTKIDANLLRPCFATELRVKNLTLSLKGATSRRFWSPRAFPDVCGRRFWASWSAVGHSLGAPEACRGRPETPLRRSMDTFGTLWGATGCPTRILGPILPRFRPFAKPRSCFLTSLALCPVDRPCQRQPQRIAHRPSLHRAIWDDVLASSGPCLESSN